MRKHLVLLPSLSHTLAVELEHSKIRDNRRIQNTDTSISQATQRILYGVVAGV